MYVLEQDSSIPLLIHTESLGSSVTCTESSLKKKKIIYLNEFIMRHVNVNGIGKWKTPQRFDGRVLAADSLAGDAKVRA